MQLPALPDNKVFWILVISFLLFEVSTRWPF